jgi:hypothetical protein
VIDENPGGHEPVYHEPGVPRASRFREEKEGYVGYVIGKDERIVNEADLQGPLYGKAYFLRSHISAAYIGYNVCLVNTSLILLVLC